MGKRKPIVAAKAAAWFCEDGHLHLSLVDEDDNEIAAIALDTDDGLEVVEDLLRDIYDNLGIIIVTKAEEDDGIGPVMGSC